MTQARRRGIRTHIINTADRLARTAEVNALADEISVVDPDDPADCVRWAKEQLAQGDRFDIVLGLRDTVLAATAEVATALGVPGNSPDAISRVRNKDTGRQALAAAGFRQPAVRLCTDAEQAVAFLRETVGPWVVKPRDAMGSIGVRKVTGAEDIPAALALLPRPDLFLIEEYVDGPEYSVEGVFLQGRPKVLAVTAKQVMPPPHFVELGHVLPAELPENTRSEIDEQVCAALTALGLSFGIFHVELWLAADGIVLGEVHARPGGEWLHRLLQYAIPDLELFGLIFDDWLGHQPRLDLTPTRAGSSRYFAPPPGRLVEVDGWEQLLAEPAVLHADLNIRPGDVIRPVRQSGDRSGAIAVGADTPQRARDLAVKLAAMVDFTTVSPDAAAEDMDPSNKDSI
ncbi:ATP-grasp domain-containing protein [Nocardia suismassiliense]|uniref:ATP-grasp domain-containing protein n=1 Tax=Nocardia suismassiliense TaxID=2077092 RepID=A0ABW6QMV7_9NOCA